MPKWSLLGLILFGLMFNVADFMRFDLISGSTKCISDDIKTNSMTVGKYSVVNLNEDVPIPDSHMLTVRVLRFSFFIFPIQCSTFPGFMFMFTLLHALAFLLWKLCSSFEIPNYITNYFYPQMIWWSCFISKIFACICVFKLIYLSFLEFCLFFC